ncbi:MAG TPA: hypothetical protein VNW54_05315 [Granulicella sp.]|jgi:photosystem II stability/assembly factor-like uncharacterized protein|nr:hypothetical protein [Granulicella sp.]
MDFLLISLRPYLRLCSVLVLLSCLSFKGWAVPWFPFGPNGGDARTFASDPHDHDHLYLGTDNGWIYDSHNGGQSWKRLARINHRADLVLDNIIVDPVDSKHVVVGGWVLGQSGGGLFVSHDGGLTWKGDPDLNGQSIRALSSAPSDPKIMVAGTLQGVFRSTDNGVHWTLISPAGSTEIHEVESIAIDPVDPTTIYAGTWHLPWKTTDGGEHWSNIKQGLIDDSDVFSIIVDPKQPKVVYASACSGIYKSENGGERFSKVQGIPSAARRTRVLTQDPKHLSTVYAGTTEGLFRTDDAGSYWMRTTSSGVIVNDVYVDPANSRRVLLATDRGGVLASTDGGSTFSASNSGFSSRQVTAFTQDLRHPSDLYIGVVNDKEWGGAFISHDGGLSWMQRAQGLEGRDVFSLAQADNGTIVAGTEKGLFWYDQDEQLWKRTGNIGAVAMPAQRPVHRGATQASRHRPEAPVKSARQIEGSVLAIAPVGDQLYAVTSQGVYVSENPAALWAAVPGLSAAPWQFVASSRGVTMLASLGSIALSVDGGRTWRPVSLPANLSQVSAIAVDDQGELWVGGRQGVFLSTDKGASWTTLKDLYVSDVNGIYFDSRNQRVLVTANASTTMAFAVRLPNKTVNYWDTGWHLRFVRPVGDYLVGATLFDGIVLQPRMVQSKEVASH